MGIADALCLEVNGDKVNGDSLGIVAETCIMTFRYMHRRELSTNGTKLLPESWPVHWFVPFESTQHLFGHHSVRVHNQSIKQCGCRIKSNARNCICE